LTLAQVTQKRCSSICHASTRYHPKYHLAELSWISCLVRNLSNFNGFKIVKKYRTSSHFAKSDVCCFQNTLETLFPTLFSCQDLSKIGLSTTAAAAKASHLVSRTSALTNAIAADYTAEQSFSFRMGTTPDTRNLSSATALFKIANRPYWGAIATSN